MKDQVMLIKPNPQNPENENSPEFTESRKRRETVRNFERKWKLSADLRPKRE